MKFKNIIYVILCLITLSSCNLKPAYRKTNNEIYNFLEAIEISPISSIEGADFYNHLKNILPPSKDEKYSLVCRLSYSSGFNILEDNADILRETNILKVSYKIIYNSTEENIFSGEFTRYSSFNTSFSPYSNVIEQQNDKKHLAVSAAEELKTRLLLFKDKVILNSKI